MSVLAQAIRQERWEIAALLLVRALLETARLVPDDAIPQLLDALEGDLHASS